MDTSLAGKVSFVGGGTRSTGAGIIATLLKEGATVIVPVLSAADMKKLKEEMLAIKGGKLVIFLMDYPDYEKGLELVEHIQETFGHIDIAIIELAHAGTCPSLTGLDIRDWYRTNDTTINAGFIGASILLNTMKKQGHGVYISIGNTVNPEANPENVLQNIAACTQVELAKVFAAEAKKFGVQCYHLFLQKGPDENDGEGFHKTDTGNYIVNLLKNPADKKQVFQWLPQDDVTVHKNFS